MGVVLLMLFQSLERVLRIHDRSGPVRHLLAPEVVGMMRNVHGVLEGLAEENKEPVVLDCARLEAGHDFGDAARVGEFVEPGLEFEGHVEGA